MPLVVSVPAELSCVCTQIAAVMWHTGPVCSERCPWGAHAVVGGAEAGGRVVAGAFPSGGEAISRRTGRHVLAFVSSMFISVCGCAALSLLD